MNSAEAAKLLEVSADTAPEQLEARFLELRRKLEDKIARAPTPGLQAKYRASLAEVTEAFECLTLAADASALPVLHRPAAANATPTPTPATAAAVAAPLPNPPAARPAAAPRKSSSREFIIVAILAVAVLGAGGAWIFKLRAEHAERVRQEAAAKLAAEKAAAEAKAAADAEKQRLDALNATLRAQLAEARTSWDALEREAQAAERAASEAKSDYREAREKSAEIRAELVARATLQKAFADWLPPYLSAHPAKVMLAKLDALIGARAFDEAQAVQQELGTAIEDAARAIREHREHAHNPTVTLDLTTQPAGLDWSIASTFDGDNRVTFSGKTPARQPRFVGLGPAVLTIRRAGWPDFVQQVVLDPATPLSARAEFPGGTANLTATPTQVKWELLDASGALRTGTTPAEVKDVAPGSVKVTFKRDGFKDVTRQFTIKAHDSVAVSGELRAETVVITVAEPDAEIWVNGKFLGRQNLTLTDHRPGDYQLELRHPRYPRYRTKLSVGQFTASGPVTARTVSYSFQRLAQPTETCPSCSGRGQFSHNERCADCNGRGNSRCTSCEGRGYHMYEMLGKQTCPYCKGTGREQCLRCEGRGILTIFNTCTNCNGGGRVSLLQLSQ